MHPVKKQNPKIMPCVPPIMKQLEDVKDNIEKQMFQELEAAAELGPIELARAFVTMRHLKDHIEECFKEFNKKFEELKTVTLPAVFDGAGVPTVNLDEGYRVTVSHRLWASIRPGDKAAAFKWLRDNQLGDLVTETVNASTLSAAAKSMAEENRELSPDLFNVAIVPNTSVTRT